MSEINFNMLSRFLDLENLCEAIAHVLKKILRILSFVGHLGRHLEYFNFPNDAKVASFSFNVRTYWKTHLCKNILCGLFFLGGCTQNLHLATGLLLIEMFLFRNPKLDYLRTVCHILEQLSGIVFQLKLKMQR